MIIKSVARLALMFVFLLLPIQAVSGQGYTVTLVNGNTLSANSYTVEGDNISLRFPVGEAGFSLSEVASIKDEAGNDMLFQEKGVYVQSASEDAMDSREQQEGTVYGESRQHASSEKVPYVNSQYGNAAVNAAPPDRGTDVQRTWQPAYYSAQTEEIDRFIDEVFAAEERGEEISEEEYDRVFSAFFEEDDGQAGSRLQD